MKIQKFNKHTHLKIVWRNDNFFSCWCRRRRRSWRRCRCHSRVKLAARQRVNHSWSYKHKIANIFVFMLRNETLNSQEKQQTCRNWRQHVGRTCRVRNIWRIAVRHVRLLRHCVRSVDDESKANQERWNHANYFKKHTYICMCMYDLIWRKSRISINLRSPSNVRDNISQLIVVSDSAMVHAFFANRDATQQDAVYVVFVLRDVDAVLCLRDCNSWIDGKRCTVWFECCRKAAKMYIFNKQRQFYC